MARQWALLLACLLLSGFLLSEAAKILTVSSLGGSHYLLLDQVSQILQDHGHDVTMLLNEAFLIQGRKETSYKVISWLPSEDRRKKHKHFIYFGKKLCIAEKHLTTL
ncbi:UDP-glucuronosyltransferase 3A1 [Vulpes lagopus]|uniref:UDP-glucuronosyltransferase 3A1-like n=1 Tax=Vulpes lagopus TaxID=494514 RepID=UPI001BCA45D2|nr:UDP-glucuronosyltransferase 3A1-like [Vulpes lagopus]